jgi:alpha-D-xyloside xylohydrolase
VRLSLAAALAASALLAAAPAAAADVQITDAQVVVTDDEGGRAVVTRSPFAIAFLDAAGNEVLTGVKGPLEAAVPQPVAFSEEPLGFEALPEAAAYAPLAFEVGVDRNVQHPGGLWTGNQLTGGRAGVLHLPTTVEKAEPTSDGGVAMVVGTTDPSRKLQVTVTPDAGSSLRVRAAVSFPGGVSAFTASFGSADGEAFRGFGGRTNLLDQRGQDFYNWVEEEHFGARETQPGVSAVPGTGGDRYRFPQGAHSSYYVQNLFVSSRPYGFLLNETAMTRWRMASDRPDAWQVSSSDEDLDFTVALGDGLDAIRSLTEITGRHRMPPDWATGPIVKRNVRQGNDSPESQQQKITKDLETIEKLDLHLDGYIYEAWDTLPLDFIRATNARLRARGIHPIGYVRAYVNDDGNFDPPGMLQEALDEGVLVQTPAGTPFFSVAVGPAGLIDFTNPKAVAWWERRKIRKMLDLGFDGFMQDFGEQVNDDMRFHDTQGRDVKEMHNHFPVVYHRVTREILDRYEREHPERGPIWMYTRTGFTGRPGSAGDEHGNFPGDQTSDWQRSSGFPASATDMLNRQVGGLFGFTTDIGGYFDQFGAQKLDAELFSRWAEWSALTPYFRLHNSSSDGTKMPWDFDEQTLAIWRKHSDLHHAARPLIRSLWREGVRTGEPIVRPLWLAFPGDAEAAKQDQEWMFGPDVLVAPVVEKGAVKREVYFPAGEWVHPETGERHRGPATVEVEAPIDRLPYFFRAGTDPLHAAAAKAGETLGLPSARKCVSRRRFEIRVRRWRGQRLRSARVFVDGRRVKVRRRGGRLRAIVDLRGKAEGIYRVRIVARTRSGRRVVGSRTYRTCTLRRPAKRGGGAKRRG